MSEHKTITEGRFLRFVDVDGWEFVQRTGSSGVVCIVAVTTRRQILLVEQFRPALNANVIELPAGLAGDLEDSEESLETAARRELMEETGYEAQNWTHLCNIVSSAGLTDEIVTVFRANRLRKTGPGGGDESESIVVHEVDLDSLNSWLNDAAGSGKCIDSRIYGTMTFLEMSPCQSPNKVINTQRAE
ncbi:MAG: NUDIX hydrolase [Fuerstiella sp.]|nr:NUDIX hydrolase [Fuerstiella sp.]